MSGAAAPAVQVEGLTKRFGDFVAVDRVTFDVRPGEIFGFLGPNGAGKTTTIKMLTGLDRIKRQIGYMSQLFSLYADLTVEENIRFFAGLYGVERARRLERRDWVLEIAGLTEHRRRLTGELPLGWKQRLALGCAVIHEPSTLFLDEPTSGVDPISRRRFWDLIYELAGDGTTVFVSTHYMEEAEYCHRMALMNRGALIALDTPAALREELRVPIVEIETNDAPQAVTALGKTPGVRDAAMFGRRIHATVDDSTTARGAIADALERHGLEVGDMTDITPSLEDVFVALVRRAGGVPDE